MPLDWTPRASVTKLRILLDHYQTTALKRMFMSRTVFLGFYFWILMMLTLIVYLPYLLLRYLSRKATDGYLRFFIRGWARHILFVAGVRIDARGLEHIPSNSRFALVSNHQSYFDIPVLMALIPYLLGFVAKKELDRIPIANLWMRAMTCVMIDRKKPSESMELVRRRIEQARKGYPLVLFPEGTRSRGAHLGRFKTGSLQMLFKSDLTILPVSISGSYRLLEETNRLRKGSVKVTFHPPVTGTGRSREDTREMVEQLRETIRSGCSA